MRFVSYNIQYATGLDGQVDLERIVRESSGADVIAYQEVERWFGRSGDVDQVEAIAELLPDYHWVYGGGVDLNADVVTSDGRVQHRRRTFGNMLLSRYPIVSSRNHLLPKIGSVSPTMSIQRSALEGSIEFPSGRLRVYSVHLSHLTSEERLSQVEALIDVHHRAVFEGFPVNGDLDGIDLAKDIPDQTVSREAIVLGDFNMEPDSPEYDLITGPVSPWGGRVVNPDGFVDAWTYLDHELLDGATCDGLNDRARLDYCFISTPLSSRLKSMRVDDDAVGSDHLPIWVDMDL